MNYCELTDIGLTGAEATLAIQAASAKIEFYTGDIFYSQTATAKVFSGRGRSMLLIKPRLLSVTTLEELNETSGEWEELDSDDYDWYYNRVIKRLKYEFAAGKSNVRVTGNWGWTSVPPLIKLACMKLAKQYYYGESDSDISSERLGNFSASYKRNGSNVGYIGSDVAGLLNDYILHKVYGGRVVPGDHTLIDDDPRDWNT